MLLAVRVEKNVEKATESLLFDIRRQSGDTKCVHQKKRAKTSEKITTEVHQKVQRRQETTAKMQNDDRRTQDLFIETKMHKMQNKNVKMTKVLRCKCPQREGNDNRPTKHLKHLERDIN